MCFLYMWLIGYQEKRATYMYGVKSLQLKKGLIWNSLTETADEECLREYRQQ